MFVISDVDLDRYQMKELYRDAYVEGKRCGLDIPEYYGFVYCGPSSTRKLPLESDEDWLDLFSRWECASGKIPIYMPPVNAPTTYNVIIQQLDKSQPPPTVENVGDRGVSVVGVTPDESESDFEVCGIVGRKECEEGIYSSKAKE